ncbi:class I SAM-dependent methyltransferase [Maridesulfovibrio frigidus]|uniref:class I SAM-dependent methyltransferase n=1 Tax=Maridesulfovibrio frigidus TaxID=340956 RepID=UPI0004E2577D|nr:class I SAM-dependent methyltransferase [Maridesulfovibrio frigidus]
MSNAIRKCSLCLSPSVEELPEIQLKGVTSDCNPWPCSGVFCICRDCGHIQKKMTSRWLKDVANIYSEYNSYPLSEAKEQLVYDNGMPISRNKRLLNLFSKEITLPATGKILDIGCGKGQFLRCFSEMYNGWDLFGCDQQEDLRSEIMSIPKACNYYTQNFEKIDEKFNFISLLYVIEHLFEPVEMLRSIKDKLHDGGVVFIQTGDLKVNPFDLAVVDHCSYFTLSTLEQLMRQAGFKIIASSNAWNSKEIGVLAQRDDNIDTPTKIINYYQENMDLIHRHNSWLTNILDDLKDFDSNRKIGILGTAISGTWLASSLQRESFFWVDEDLSQTGKKHMGAVVMSIKMVPANSMIYLPFPNSIARDICSRLQKTRPDIEFKYPQ